MPINLKSWQEIKTAPRVFRIFGGKTGTRTQFEVPRHRSNYEMVKAGIESTIIPISYVIGKCAAGKVK
jgi:hypothetical protein